MTAKKKTQKTAHSGKKQESLHAVVKKAISQPGVQEVFQVYQAWRAAEDVAEMHRSYDAELISFSNSSSSLPLAS